ncbi:MAG: HipA N-terminal domain-containing protein [Mucilaginibacter sp.]|uniref:HipA N-terminal domain-containing protein n=1 Tax=Mucilaginibacter sp. TaxID=1882438 RepID=UPI0032654315
MRQAKIIFKGEEAGIISQHDNGSFSFLYNPSWTEDSRKPAISLTLPKQKAPYQSDHLFPFFYNMLPEGSNKQVVCKLNRIDLDDYFGLLLVTAKHDTIGAVNIQKIEMI